MKTLRLIEEETGETDETIKTSSMDNYTSEE